MIAERGRFPRDGRSSVPSLTLIRTPRRRFPQPRLHNSFLQPGGGRFPWPGFQRASSPQTARIIPLPSTIRPSRPKPCLPDGGGLPRIAVVSGGGWPLLAASRGKVFDQPLYWPFACRDGDPKMPRLIVARSRISIRRFGTSPVTLICISSGSLGPSN